MNSLSKTSKKVIYTVDKNGNFNPLDIFDIHLFKIDQLIKYIFQWQKKVFYVKNLNYNIFYLNYKHFIE